MTTKHVIFEEQRFLTALHEDYKIRSDKSFLSVMFFATDGKNISEGLESLFEGSKLNAIIDDSDIIIESSDALYIGKYKYCFWGSGSEGEIFSMGTKLHQLPYDIICLSYNYEEEKEEVLERLKRNHQIDYLQYVEDYKVFCRKFGWKYIEECEAPSSITEAFNNLVESIQL